MQCVHILSSLHDCYNLLYEAVFYVEHAELTDCLDFTNIFRVFSSLSYRL